MREIQVRNNNGRCLIRFNFGGRSHSLTLGNYTDKVDRARAEALASKIYADCLAGNFDPTLSSYKPISFSVARRLADRAIAQVKEIKAEQWELVTNWGKFVEFSNLTERQYTNHWKPITIMLAKYGKPITLTEVPKFISWMNSRLSSKTVNDRLSYLRKCCKWAITQGIMTTNPFEGVKAQRARAKPKPKPFSKEEIGQIIIAFENSRYYSHYTDYVKFLFATGVRTSEAIGLRWKHISFSREEIEIYEVMARGDDGSSSHRVRKGTKTENLRAIPCKGKLKAMLQSRKDSTINLKPDDLVFPSPTGTTIDDNNFRDRAWRKILDEVGIEYRHPYIMRHSFISHMVEDGVPLTGIAYIAGHRDTTMIQKTYGHMINRPDLPDLL
ncbi:site-specific integrase [Synechocystis sp. PCC 7509]|uniref:site-specific integrase n=1 Tax=Synechocystis sp. PCC 7509 TaxID=927677 RepID=UPI0002AC8652|nr:site-specific integrase [Synechocystis sp. PCC 7509]